MIVLSVLNTFAASVGMAVAAWIGLRLVRANAATRYWTWWAVLGALAAMLWWPQPVAPVAASIPMVPMPAPIEVAPRVDWFVWIALFWAGFAVYRLLRIALSYAHLRTMIRGGRLVDSARLNVLREAHGVKRWTQVLLSDDVAGPISAGYLRASIILPESLLERLTAAEVDHVLLHELAHIARRDDWTKLIARLAGAVLGLHPVAAFALARIEREREHACDDWVAAATGDPRAYAASLARVFELSRGNKEILAAGMTGSKLGNRVHRLLTSGYQFTRRASGRVFLVIAAILTGAVIATAQSPAWIVLMQESLPVSPNAPVPPSAAVIRPAPAPVATPVPASPQTPRSPARLMAAQCIGGTDAGCSDPVTRIQEQLASLIWQSNQEEQNQRLRESTILPQLYKVMEEKRQELVTAWGKADRDAEIHNYEVARREYYDTATKIAGPNVVYVNIQSPRRLDQK